MTKDQVRAVLERVSTWPGGRQQELAELALEIEAELAGASYEATPHELTAIDEGLAGEAASEEEIKAAFARLPAGVKSRVLREIADDSRPCPKQSAISRPSDEKVSGEGGSVAVETRSGVGLKPVL